MKIRLPLYRTLIDTCRMHGLLVTAASPSAVRGIGRLTLGVVAVVLGLSCGKPAEPAVPSGPVGPTAPTGLETRAVPDPPSVTTATTTPPGAFPLPDPMPAMTDAECVRALGAVRAELALADDVWLSVSCIVDAMMRENQVDRAGAFLENVHRFETRTDFWLDVKRADAVAAHLEPAPDSGELVKLYASPSARVRHPTLKQVDSETLGAGGYRDLCIPWLRKPDVVGHYQVTKRAVKLVRDAKFSITSKAEDIMADASQDPDLFAWNSMPAHGQTADEDGVPKETESAAEDNFRKWVADWMQEAGKRCASADPKAQVQGVYLLGYALHAVEDVASHRGRTNPEHAYNAAHETNPDKVKGVDDLAVEMAADTLLAALEGRARACVAPLRTIQSGLLLFPQKVREFKFAWDGTPSNFWAYKASASAFQKIMHRPRMRIRWFGPEGDWTKGTSCASDVQCKAVLGRLKNALK